MTPETLEFRLGRRRSFAVLLPVLPVPLSSLLLPALLPSEYGIRWSGVVGLLLVGVGLVLFQLRAVTTLDRKGLTFREVGRPWRLPRPTTIPWSDISVIEARKYGRFFLPIVHLSGGGWVRLRIPAERSLAKISGPIAELQRWHLEYGGPEAGRNAAPAVLPRPPARRRLLVAAGAAIVIVADVAAMGAMFAHLIREPPEVMNCTLVPPDLIRRIVPGAEVTRGDPPEPARPGDPCRWAGPRHKDETAGTTLMLSAASYPEGFTADDYADDLAIDRARHLIHPIPGVRGHTWALLRSGKVEAEARAVTGGYTIRAELDGAETDGLTRAEAERRLGELVRAVTARLTRTETGMRAGMRAGPDARTVARTDLGTNAGTNAGAGSDGKGERS